ncbi:AraC family transcriptional regulator [Solirubrobacter phytolaccae]|uniref:AraC family transcriptional regulator n=1 Tax=Solirubrobacter phytolaccae TaxID=1404360 RepID=A0A9X3N8V6_9ACTN|nr:AraC family transcriptional regulator [Solirubrobacter phytolaccae]MDA0180397.1 AraC family transcriptional regulator [Solirubrobacter phytolaccae]
MKQRPSERGIALDPLGPSALEVERFHDHNVVVPRHPHRHDFHELFWTHAGVGHHLIDGEPFPVQPGTVTIVGRGQVHVFERAVGLHGAVVRFGDELLHTGARADPGWLLARRGTRTIGVPEDAAGAVDAVVAALAAETRHPPDPRRDEITRHLLLTLLLWLERWYDADTAERDDADTELFRRFATVLERDFARHHDAVHYADALAVPQRTLTRALRAVTGKGTKELVRERVLLEAARLLRFSDLEVGEVAFRTGFDDRLYFSRTFRRAYGEAPTAYRARQRG